MSDRVHCPRCSRPVRIVVDTDMHGRLVDLTEPCACEGRLVCVDCNALFGEDTPLARAKRCEPCRKAHKRQRQAEWRQHKKATDPEWVARTRERDMKRHARWIEANPEKYRAQRRRRSIRETETVKERNRRYREQNRERLIQYDRMRHAAQKEARNADKRERERLKREILRRAA